MLYFFFFQAEDGIRDKLVTGVQTCALPICARRVRHTTHSYDGESPPRRRTAPPPLARSPPPQPDYRRALHGQPLRKRRGWRRYRGAEASWTAERDMQEDGRIHNGFHPPPPASPLEYRRKR